MRLAAFTIFVSATATFIAVALAIILGFWIISKQRGFERQVLLGAQALNATPPTVVGIFFYYLCTQFDTLKGLLFTPAGMIIGQIILGLPIAYYLFAQLLSTSIDKVYDLGICTVDGERRFQRTILLGTVLLDIRALIVPTSFIVFGRLVGEVGAILIIGGGIHGKTDTLATSIVMQTHMGDIESALVSGIVLLAIVVMTRFIVLGFERRKSF
ncbi:MAG: ABC transporter permease [Rhodobacter sp.]|nr:ABC transporter permease [Rhodobacter sp.]